MKKILFALLMGVSMYAHAAIYFLQYETQTPGSFTKQCHYSGVMGTYVLNKPATSLCPLQINR